MLHNHIRTNRTQRVSFQHQGSNISRSPSPPDVGRIALHDVGTAGGQAALAAVGQLPERRERLNAGLRQQVGDDEGEGAGEQLAVADDSVY